MNHIKKLLKDNNKDYYIYDLTALKKRIQYIRQATHHNIYYAVKANSDVKILETLLHEVTGFEVASPGEIQKVRSISSTVPIIYGGPVKTHQDLEYALKENIKSIQIESLQELDALKELTSEMDTHIEVMLRINLKNIKSTAELKMAGVPTQFGLPFEDVEEAISICHSTNLITLKGFHFHAMSNNLNEEVHVEFIKQAYKFAEQYRTHLPKDYQINVGGGIGIDYQEKKQFDFEYFSTLIKDYPTLIFELGRFVTAPIGYYAANVFDIKKMHDEYFILLNGGTNHFRFPKAWNHNQSFTIIEGEDVSYRNKSLSHTKATITGKLCTPNDVFGPPYEVSNIKIGDWIVFKYAGSYSYDISHLQFLSHELPEILYI